LLRDAINKHKRGLCHRVMSFCLFGGWLAVTFVEMAKDTAIVAMEYKLETAPKLSNGRPLPFLYTLSDF